MAQAITTPQVSLEAFLAMPETKPASEYINGHIVQKPMPQGQHSRIQGKLAHCLLNGSEIGWLIDPDDFAVTVFQPNQMVSFLRGDTKLPIPSVIHLELTVDDVFGWLRVGGR